MEDTTTKYDQGPLEDMTETRKDKWTVAVILENNTVHAFQIASIHLLSTALTNRNLTEIKSITLS